MNLLKSILQSLKESKYLTANCTIKNEKIGCKSSLLKNGIKLRNQLLKQWTNTTTDWATQTKPIQQIEKNIKKNESRISFLKENEFQKTYVNIYKQTINHSPNTVVKTICNHNPCNVISKGNLFYGSQTKTLLVTEYFLTSESELSTYYNLQRERKIWWMRFSANPSRYWVEPFDLSPEEEQQGEICKNSKSITIKAKFAFGSVDMEHITLVPLYKFGFLNLRYTENSLKFSIIRSIINLDLITSDASDYSTDKNKNRLMLHRKLAPYQVLLANIHQGNNIVDDLTIHLHHVISRSGLRLYDKLVHSNIQTELDKKLAEFDSFGIPYTLVVDDNSTKNGLIKLRSRDTTLFETLHISDIPNYLLYIFKP